MTGASRLLALSAAALAACGQEPASAPPTRPAVATAPANRNLPDEQRAPDLFGAWRIEQVATDRPMVQDGSHQQILLVGSRQLEALSQCVTVGPFDYGRTVGGGIKVSLQPAPPRREPNGRARPSRPQCARMLSPAERALGPILLAAEDVRVADGVVIISGPAGTLRLRRPTGALANPRGEAPAPSLPLIGAWQVISVNGRDIPAGAGIEFLARPNVIEWRSGCVNEVRRLLPAAAGLLPGDFDPFPVCERGRSPAEQNMGRLTAGPISARRGPEDSRILSGSGVTAVLVPLTTLFTAD